MNRLNPKKLLITSGPTQEPIDPVRFISNHSSGKLGYELAMIADQNQWDVSFVSGPVHESMIPYGDHITHYCIQTAEEMFEQVKEILPHVEGIVALAAVSDYKSKKIEFQKSQKKANWVLELELTPDIAEYVGHHKNLHQKFIGFALETDHIFEHAESKMVRKKMDSIILNTLDAMGKDQSQFWNKSLLDSWHDWGYITKKECAFNIINLLNQLLKT